MFDQLFDSFRRTSESSLQMQQEMFRPLTQQWGSAPAGAPGLSGDWGRSFHKRWYELAMDGLNRHREALNATYKSGIQMIEQAFRATEAKSSDDYRQTVEDLWKRMFDNFRDQSEAQFRDFKTWAEKSLEMVQKTDVH
jgi:hypothetical protein